MTEAGAVALRAEGVRVRLGGAEILRGVDLTVGAAQVVGVLGPSGAGKSTLFRALVGDLVPGAGRIYIGLRDVGHWPLWRRARLGLGYVPQTPSVLFDLTLRQNLRAFEQAARVAPQPAAERAEPVGLGAKLDVLARDLSGGERRRLELLRALIGSPTVLVCDEPLTGLDPTGVRRVGELLREQTARGAAVLLADHRIREVLPFCDRAVLLVDGRIELDASPAEFATHGAVHARYLG